MDKKLRSLERLQDPLRLKLLQRRLGQGVYVQDAPRPIQVFNDTELLTDIPNKDMSVDGYEGRYGLGYGEEVGYGDRNGDGHGYGNGSGQGTAYSKRRREGEGGYGFGGAYGYENKKGFGSGYGYGYGYGSEFGEPDYYYTQDLRKKYDR